MPNKIRDIMSKYPQEKKRSAKVYIILRVFVIVCMVMQLLRGEIGNAFMCVLSLILFTLPVFFQTRFKFRLPGLLEIIIYLFIFAAEILGEIYNFYGNIPMWDSILHTINGFICAGIGFGLIELLNENSKKIRLSPIYVAVVAFCFSMTIGVCWEFFEYSADKFLKMDMQKDTIVREINSVALNEEQKNKAVRVSGIEQTVLYDADGNELAVIEGGYLDIGLNDTMKDLFLNLIGATVFSVSGFLYAKNKEKYNFAGNFIPVRAEGDNEEVRAEPKK